MPATGIYANGGPYIGTPCGYQQMTSIGAATGPTVPVQAKYAVIVAEAQAARWRDDGTSPTSTVGMLLPVNTPFTYLGNLGALKFIQSTAGTIVNIAYYY